VTRIFALTGLLALAASQDRKEKGPDEYGEGNATVFVTGREKDKEILYLNLRVRETPTPRTLAGRREYDGKEYQFHPDKVAEVDAEVLKTGQRELYSRGLPVFELELPPFAAVKGDDAKEWYHSPAKYTSPDIKVSANYPVDLKVLGVSDATGFYLVVAIRCIVIGKPEHALTGEVKIGIPLETPVEVECRCGGLDTPCPYCAMHMQISQGKKRGSQCPMSQETPEGG
jgi:hypothetical protein